MKYVYLFHYPWYSAEQESSPGVVPDPIQCVVLSESRVGGGGERSTVLLGQLGLEPVAVSSC